MQQVTQANKALDFLGPFVGAYLAGHSFIVALLNIIEGHHGWAVLFGGLSSLVWYVLLRRIFVVNVDVKPTVNVFAGKEFPLASSDPPAP